MRLQWVGADVFRSALQKGEDVSQYGVLKSVVPEVIREIDQAGRIIEFTISTASVDRVSDTIDVTGWDLMAHSQNPVVLFAHDQWNPPVGQALATWVESSKLKSRTQFVEREIYPFAYMIFQLYAGKYMRATSVGFRPLEYSFAEDRKWGINFMRQELLEYSCVPVPANPEALMDAKAHGIDVSPMKSWADRWLDETKSLKNVSDDKVRGTIERMRALSDPSGRSLLLCMGDMKMPGCGCDDKKTACDKCGAEAGVNVDCTTCQAIAGSPAAKALALKSQPTVTDSQFPHACQHGHGHKTAAEAASCNIVAVVALPKGVSRLERFGCGHEKHVHATALEAATCAGTAPALKSIGAAILALLPAAEVKEGRVLSRANEDRLRRANELVDEVLAQLADAEVVEEAAPAAPAAGGDPKSAAVFDLGAAKDTDAVLELDDDPAPVVEEGLDFGDLSLDDVREAVAEAVREQRMLLTGQVD